MNIRRYSSFQVKADAFAICLVEEDELQVEACELLAVKADRLDLEKGDEWIVRGQESHEEVPNHRSHSSLPG